jgi:hypothetical protein
MSSRAFAQPALPDEVFNCTLPSCSDTQQSVSWFAIVVTAGRSRLKSASQGRRTVHAEFAVFSSPKLPVRVLGPYSRITLSSGHQQQIYSDSDKTTREEARQCTPRMQSRLAIVFSRIPVANTTRASAAPNSNGAKATSC